MTLEVTYNALPEEFNGEQKRRTEFSSADEKLAYDADGLIALAKETYGKNVTVNEALYLTSRTDDNINDLRRAISMKLKNTEQVVEKSVESLKRELTPEAAEQTLRTLQTRFYNNGYLHEDCDWSRVKSALETNPEALWSVNQMEEQGHEPDVYSFDDNGFDIGTCSKEPPKGSRNCVYDAQAATWIKENYKNPTSPGNAVDMAKAMGINLMSQTQYEEIIRKSEEDSFDKNTSSWLLTDKKTRESSNKALYGHNSLVFNGSTHDHRDSGGFRGSLRVLWT